MGLRDAILAIDRDLQERGHGDDGRAVLGGDAPLLGDVLVELQAIGPGEEGNAFGGLLRGRDDGLVERGDLVGERCPRCEGVELGRGRRIALDEGVGDVDEDVFVVEDGAGAGAEVGRQVALMRKSKPAIAGVPPSSV